LGALESNGVEVTSHQTGSTILSKIYTGRAPITVTLTLKEYSKENLEAMIKNAGGESSTPVAGTEVYSWGSGKQFTQNIENADKLILHPVTVTGVLEDYAFWNAIPLLDSISFSGENPVLMSVTFECYPDLAKPANVQWGVFGDHTQTFA